MTTKMISEVRTELQTALSAFEADSNTFNFRELSRCVEQAEETINQTSHSSEIEELESLIILAECAMDDALRTG